VSDWREEKRSFDYSYRRTGKTTKLCNDIADALRDDPDLRVILTGAYVMRNRSYYVKLLTEAGADLNRVRFTPPAELDRRVRGVRGKLFCDDFHDLDLQEMHSVVEAERYLDEPSSGGA
jgi:hypothetical protein